MTFDLNKREYGGWFAPIERDFLFLKSQEHIGWVVHASDKTFRLKLTPFFEHYRDYLYIVPEGQPMPPQNACIEVKPLKIVQQPIFNDRSTFGKYQNFCIIDGYKEFRFNIKDHKPDIGYKDFKYQCALNWKDAAEDDLDLMLALELLSCPASIYGIGGIGTIASKLSNYGKLSNTVIPNLKVTYNTILAKNFRKMNDKYYFNMINNKQDVNVINNLRRNNPCEVNYCKPCISAKDALAVTESLPVQIPMLIKSATYKKAELAEPYLLLQYQITALMYNPTFAETNNALANIEDNIRKIMDERNILNVDANTVNKLATAFSRLYLDSNVKTGEINEATDLFLQHVNDWKPYLWDYEAEKLRRNREQITALIYSEDIKIKHSRDHEKFLVELQKLHDETGEKWISLDDIEKKFEKSVYDIAVDLSNSGLILQQFNFSKIKKVNI
jgi:hypothetical protein